MASIPFVPQENLLSPRDRPEFANAQPNQAFTQGEKFLEEQATQDAAFEGLNTLGNFRAQQSQRQEQLKTTVKSPDGFTPVALNDFDDQSQKLLSNIDNPRVAAFLQQHLPQARLEIADNALHWEASAKQEQRVTNMTEGLNGLGAIVLRNPASYGNAVQEWDSTLASSGLDVAMQTKLRLAGREQLTMSYGDAYVRSDPTKALHAFNTDPAFATLPPDKLFSLQQHADTKIQHLMAVSDHAMVVAERQRKLAGDQLAKEGDDLIAKGQMTEDWFQKNRSLLAPSDYRILRQQAQEGGGTDSSAFLANVYPRLYSQGEDVSADVTQALNSRIITPQTAKSLFDENKQQQGVTSPRRQGLAYITDALKVSQLNPDPAAAQRLADAVAEFNRATSTDPKADPMAVARDLTKRYALVDWQNMSLTAPLPKYAVGARDALDIAATTKATNDAFIQRHNGDKAAALADPDYQREALLLKRWKEAIEKQRAIQAAPGGVK